MDKSPISFLQEYLVRKQILPNYVVIESRSGTHLNWFKIRVECGQDSADGEGSSKKEAKLNAAKAMMNLLGISLSNQIAPASTDSTINTTINSADAKNITSPNINYIGRLQEMAQQEEKTLPEYIDKTFRGPSHSPVFTTICKFMGFEEEATASTKKEAKSLSAKKVFERINSDVKVVHSPVELNSYLETLGKAVSELKVHGENKNAMAESAQKALDLFLPLSKTNAPKKVNLQDKRSYSEYYTFLRDAFSDKVRDHVMDKLQDTIRACATYKNTNDASNLILLLKLALKDLSIDVKEVNYCTKDKSSIFGLKLDTDPVISEIGHGDTNSSAAVQSVLQMAVTVSILIS